MPLLRRPEIRRVWAVPLLCAFAQLAFLAYGNARDGAPAHHAERALLGIVFILAMFAIDALAATLPALVSRARPAVYALTALLTFGWLLNFRPLFGEDIPATPEAENRDAQVAAGRARGKSRRSRDGHPLRLRALRPRRCVRRAGARHDSPEVRRARQSELPERRATPTKRDSCCRHLGELRRMRRNGDHLPLRRHLANQLRDELDPRASRFASGSSSKTSFASASSSAPAPPATSVRSSSPMRTSSGAVRATAKPRGRWSVRVHASWHRRRRHHVRAASHHAPSDAFHRGKAAGGRYVTSRRIACKSARSRSTSPARMAPIVSGRSSVSGRRSVLFPEPFGPVSTSGIPADHASDTSRSTGSARHRR